MNQKEKNKAIETIAKGWADYIGGLHQARKAASEAYSIGFLDALLHIRENGIEGLEKDLESARVEVKRYTP